LSKQYAIFGGFGGGNLGDELIARTMITLLKDQKSVFFSFNPEYSKTHFPKTTWRDYGAIPDVWQQLKNRLKRIPKQPDPLKDIDAVIIGGGGIIYDYSLMHLIGWTFRVWHLKRRAIPFHFFLNSFVLPRTQIGKIALRWMLSHAKTVSVRDTLSLENAKVLHERVYALSSDTVFGLFAPEFTPISASLRRILIAPRPWKEIPIQYWVHLVRSLQKKGFEVNFWALDARMDGAYCRAIQKALNTEIPLITLSPTASKDAFLQTLQSYDLLIAMRFHGVILGMLSGIPLSAFSYDPKVKGLMHDSGMGSMCFEASMGDEVDYEHFIDDVIHQYATAQAPSYEVYVAKCHGQVLNSISQITS